MKISRLYKFRKGDRVYDMPLILGLVEICNDEWVCDIDMSISGEELLKCNIYGVDALQALENAIMIVSVTIKNLEKSETESVTWVGGDGSGLDLGS